MEHKIIVNNGRYDFDYIEGGNPVLSATYAGTFSSKANTTIGGKQYTVKPKGIWSTHYKLLQDGQEIGSVQFKWNGDAMIYIGQDMYSLKYRGVWHSRFELSDTNGQLLATAKLKSGWNLWKTQYSVEVLPEFTNLKEVRLLQFLIGHTLNIFLSHYMAA